MVETRRLRKGYETVGMAMSREDAMRLRVGATLARLSLGDYVASLLPRDPMAPVMPGPGAARAARALEGAEASKKAPGRLQEPMLNLNAWRADEDEQEAAWTDLEAKRKALGWTDELLAKVFGLDKANIVQWRRRGRVTRPNLGKAREFLAQNGLEPDAQSGQE